MGWPRALGFALIWCALTREPSVPNVILGVGLAALLLRRFRADAAPWPPRASLSRLGAWTRLLLGLGVDLVSANLRMVRLVLRPRGSLRPGILAVPVDAGSARELALMADLVTLTPGTLALDSSADLRVLYVHVLDIDDPERVIRELREGVVSRVREVFR